MLNESPEQAILDEEEVENLDDKIPEQEQKQEQKHDEL